MGAVASRGGAAATASGGRRCPTPFFSPTQHGRSLLCPLATAVAYPRPPLYSAFRGRPTTRRASSRHRRASCVASTAARGGVGAREDTGCGGEGGGGAGWGCGTTSRSAGGTWGGAAPDPDWAWRPSPPRAECHRRATRGPVSLSFCTPTLQSVHFSRASAVEAAWTEGEGGAGASVGAVTRSVRGAGRAAVAAAQVWRVCGPGTTPRLCQPPLPMATTRDVAGERRAESGQSGPDGREPRAVADRWRRPEGGWLWRPQVARVRWPRWRFGATALLGVAGAAPSKPPLSPSICDVLCRWAGLTVPTGCRNAWWVTGSGLRQWSCRDRRRPAAPV